MDLKCNHDKCKNVYGLDVVGVGRGFVWHVIISWQCNVCGYMNVYVRDEIKDYEIQKAGI